MSDGVYLFNEAQGREIFSGTIEIFQSKLRGENDFYKYHGVFWLRPSFRPPLHAAATKFPRFWAGLDG